MENLRLSAKIGLKWVFIPFLIILVMSHNAGALELTQDVYHIRGNMNYNFASPMNISNGCALSNYNTFLGDPNVDLACYVRSVTLEFPTETYNNGDYLTFPLYVFNNQNNNSSDATIQSLSVTASGFDLVDVDLSQLSGSVGVVFITLRSYTNNTTTTFLLTSTTGNAFANLQYGEYLASGVGTHWRPSSTVNYTQAIQSVVSAIQSSPNYSQSLNDIKDAIQNQNQEEEDAVQDAADDAADAAADNSSNSATTNLVGVLSSFLSAITNFSATDCNVTLAFPSYAGGSMTFNVCQYKDKAGSIISVFTSLTLIVFYLPLAIKLLSMIYNEIRSFTNG